MFILLRENNDKVNKIIKSLVDYIGDVKTLYLDINAADDIVPILEMVTRGDIVETPDEYCHGFIRNLDSWDIRDIEIDKNICVDGENTRCKIYFYDPYENRKVKRIDWFSNDGICIASDYFTSLGYKLYRSYYDIEGNEREKIFYKEKDKVAFTHLIEQKSVIEYDKGNIASIYSYPFEFIEKKINIDGETIILTDSIMLEQFVEWDVNGRFIPIAQDYSEAVKMANILKKNYISREVFCFDKIELDSDLFGINHVGMVSQQDDYVKDRRKVLIMTDSEQLEGIDYLTDNLKDIEFNIGANTLMSPQLMKLGEKTNVNLYPGISNEKYNELLKSCSYYLDINYYREIRNAVECAHVNGMLILGVKETIHDSRYILDECVCSKEQIAIISDIIRTSQAEETVFKTLLRKQNEKCSILWKKQ